MHQALAEYLCCTYNDLVFRKVLSPSLFYPEVTAHLSAEAFNLLIQIALEDCKLLEDKGHTVNLRDISDWKFKQARGGAYQEKGDSALLAQCTVFELFINHVFQEQDCD